MCRGFVTLVPKPKTQYWGTADPGLGQTGKALAQMVAELAATQKEQAAEANGENCGTGPTTQRTSLRWK